MNDDPAAAGGAVVRETGIALVHEGEWILPAPGSEAELAGLDASAAGGGVVEYHFPVEVEVVGGGFEARDEILAAVWDSLTEALERAT